MSFASAEQGIDAQELRVLRKMILLWNAVILTFRKNMQTLTKTGKPYHSLVKSKKSKIRKEISH